MRGPAVLPPDPWWLVRHRSGKVSRGVAIYDPFVVSLGFFLPGDRSPAGWYDLGAMFTPEDRDKLRDALVAAAHADARISSAALTGSAAVGATDRWSDVDLALGVTSAADLGRVVADWTDRMYRAHRAVHHLDVVHEGILYRVFLLASTLQVDLAFWPATEFGATGPTFRLLFGTANERPPRPSPAAAELIGLG